MVLHSPSNAQPFTVHSCTLLSFILSYARITREAWSVENKGTLHFAVGLTIGDTLTLACGARPSEVTCIPSRAPFRSCRILHSHTYCISQAHTFFLTYITILSTLPITFVLFHKHSLFLLNSPWHTVLYMLSHTCAIILFIHNINVSHIIQSSHTMKESVTDGLKSLTTDVFMCLCMLTCSLQRAKAQSQHTHRCWERKCFFYTIHTVVLTSRRGAGAPFSAFVCGVCMSSRVCIGSLWYSSYILQSNDTQVRFIDGFKVPAGVNGSV